MANIFISYRKADSLEFSRRMAAELRDYFGERAVFFDEATALPGMEWPHRIREAVLGANVVLVVIAEQWLHAQDADTGRRRLDIETDWVRQEVLTAIARREDADAPVVIPVLLGATPMPTPNDLGGELGRLCERQPIRLANTGTRYDFQQLQDHLVRLGFQPRELPPVTTPRFGKLPKQLSDQDERDLLDELENWEVVETPQHLAPGGVRRELHRVYEFPSFDLAFQFMNEVVARGVQPHNHHPRWENAYNRVEVWLTTFNLNYRPSNRDARLARICESVWTEFLALR